MKPHYTILSALVRPEIQEKITIGLLLVSANDVVFSFSKNKLAVVHTLIDKSLYGFLNETIKQIEQAVTLENSRKNTLIADEPQEMQFRESYLSYMNRYSNNLINFSAPIQIDLPANSELFSFLYKKYVDAIGSVGKRTKRVEEVKEEFYPQIIQYYNTNKELSPKDIPNLPMPVNVDIIGKNEIEVIGQIIDFERPIYNISQDVGVINILMDAFEQGKSHGFLVGNEPDKTTYPKSHSAWDDLRKWNKLEYLAWDEIDKVKEYAEKHGVKPLFCEQNN